jgi:hypothetical protein
MISIHAPKQHQLSCVECQEQDALTRPRKKKKSGKPKKITKPKAIRQTTTPKQHEITCQECGKIVLKPDKTQQFCSLACAAVNRAINGITAGSATKCVFEFEGNSIRCDSILEFACLTYFTENNTIKSISRCSFAIPYVFENKMLKFVPDFIIETQNEKFIVECKSSVGKSLSKKWHDYKEKAEIKRRLLEEHANQNGMICVWFSPSVSGEFRKVYVRVQKERKFEVRGTPPQQ